jgi:hypothetical protein
MIQAFILFIAANWIFSRLPKKKILIRAIKKYIKAIIDPV